MKLFGGTGKQLHSGKVKKTGENGEQKRFDLQKLLHSPVWRKLRIPLIALGCVVLFFLLALLIYTIWEKPPETSGEGPKTQATPSPAVEKLVPEASPAMTAAPQPTATPEPSPELTPAPLTSGRRENVYTFVILAYDQLEANTDTILVGRMDIDAGTLDMVNIPRDTLVNVSWGVKKLSSVLASEHGEMERFLEHLSNLVGFTADCYAIVNIQAVEKLVDCIGGVSYNVPRDMDYDDPSQDLYIHIPKGEQRLNGDEAVKVLRFREGNNGTGYPNGDLGRIATQQDFLKSIAAQFLTLGNIPNMSNAIEIFQSNVKTDMTANNIAFFLHEFLKLDKDNVRFHTLPGRGVMIRGGSYLEVDLDQWVEIVNSYLSPYYQEITADNLNILQTDGDSGVVSTTGETVPIESFFDYVEYVRSLNRN